MHICGVVRSTVENDAAVSVCLGNLLPRGPTGLNDRASRTACASLSCCCRMLSGDIRCGVAYVAPQQRASNWMWGADRFHVKQWLTRETALQGSDLYSSHRQCGAEGVHSAMNEDAAFVEESCSQKKARPSRVDVSKSCLQPKPASVDDVWTATMLAGYMREPHTSKRRRASPVV